RARLFFRAIWKRVGANPHERRSFGAGASRLRLSSTCPPTPWPLLRDFARPESHWQNPIFPPRNAWIRRYFIASRRFVRPQNLQPPCLQLEGAVLSPDRKPRILLVVAHFDDTRNPNGRPNFIPQGLAHAFLAGAFHRHNVELRLYSEFHSGPLKDEQA